MIATIGGSGPIMAFLLKSSRGMSDRYLQAQQGSMVGKIADKLLLKLFGYGGAVSGLLTSIAAGLYNENVRPFYENGTAAILQLSADLENGEVFDCETDEYREDECKKESEDKKKKKNAEKKFKPKAGKAFGSAITSLLFFFTATGIVIFIRVEEKAEEERRRKRRMMKRELGCCERRIAIAILAERMPALDHTESSHDCARLRQHSLSSGH